MDRVTQSGCKYIGVINNMNLKKSNLNSNLQDGCSGRRIAWDGSCSSIYHDIDGWGCTRIGKNYKTRDVVGVVVDTNLKEVSFACNGRRIGRVIRYKRDCILQPVVGFGYENMESYTISARYDGPCSSW